MRIMVLFTIGHSTHPLDRFLDLVAQHGIEMVADIRRFPGSRQHPQFNQETLAATLQATGVEYRWFEALGGRRCKTTTASSNLGLRNESFRNYADYMLTAEFRSEVGELLKIGRRKRTAFMCSEGLFWRCHRRLVSDFLLMKGITVQHIMPTGELQRHQLTKEARIDDGAVIYPPPAANPSQLLLPFNARHQSGQNEGI